MACSLTFREYCGEYHWKFGNQQYSEARNFLKNCGKPNDDYDKWLIEFNKETVKIFSKYK